MPEIQEIASLSGPTSENKTDSADAIAVTLTGTIGLPTVAMVSLIILIYNIIQGPHKGLVSVVVVGGMPTTTMTFPGQITVLYCQDETTTSLQPMVQLGALTEELTTTLETPTSTTTTSTRNIQLNTTKSTTKLTTKKSTLGEEQF